MRERESGENSEGYVVAVYTQRHPDSFRGPKKLRAILSDLSAIFRVQPTSIVGSSRGMSLKEAEEIAKVHTDIEGYTARNGKLNIAFGVPEKVDDIYHSFRIFL